MSGQQVASRINTKYRLNRFIATLMNISNLCGLGEKPRFPPGVKEEISRYDVAVRVINAINMYLNADGEEGRPGNYYIIQAEKHLKHLKKVEKELPVDLSELKKLMMEDSNGN